MKSGLATGFLERLHEQRMGVVDIPSDTTETSHLLPRFYVPMYIRTSAFKLPSKHTTPIVMVGPGTGLAPFRGFLWERFHAAENGEMVGPTWLFYGCRHRDNDWLYREEMEQMLSKLSSLSTPFDLKILTAFSRMQGEPKVYVQHRLVEYKTKVWEFIGEKNGIFYVCG